MYVEFLKSLITFVEALNTAAKTLEAADPDLSCYVNHVPVLMESELCGFIVDEIGGLYSYRDATAQERVWWENRPWKRS